MKISDYLLGTIVFYMAWVIIPIILEVMPAIFDCFILIKKKFIRKKLIPLEYFPEITVIIPVYNSAATLKNCIESIYHSNYDNKLIYILVVRNGGSDNSFEVFSQCQIEFPELNMSWVESKQGKSKALNLAIFNSAGKYIIHIDSDGVLHENALRNMVTYFENHLNIHCLTGTILTEPRMVEESDSFFMKMIRRIEFFEYAQAFLAGRNFEAEFNSIYSLSGAFSAFRKSTIFKTQLYNTDTVCEDTQITFQVREVLNQKVSLCSDAYFFVDPIETIDKLYTQRQRWQRGELEVAHIFNKSKILRKNKEVKKKKMNVIVRILMYDHTFAFPRMIWYFAIVCLLFMNYPLRLVVSSVILIYLFNVVTTLLFFLCITLFLSSEKELQKYYSKKWYLIFLLPIYNSTLFWFRFAGIINSINSEQVWKTSSLTEEKQTFFEIMDKDLRYFRKLINKVKDKIYTNEGS